jgi:hypothetical protein
MLRLAYVNDYSDDNYNEVILLCFEMRKRLIPYLKEPLEINFSEDEVGRKLIIIVPSFQENYDINQLNDIKRRLYNYKVNLVIKTSKKE